MKLTKENICVELAKEQLRRIGFKGDMWAEVRREKWYRENPWPSKEMEQEFKEWATAQIQRVFQTSKRKAESEFSWFNLCFGLAATPQAQTSADDSDAPANTAQNTSNAAT